MALTYLLTVYLHTHRERERELVPERLHPELSPLTIADLAVPLCLECPTHSFNTVSLTRNRFPPDPLPTPYAHPPVHPPPSSVSRTHAQCGEEVETRKWWRSCSHAPAVETHHHALLKSVFSHRNTAPALNFLPQFPKRHRHFRCDLHRFRWNVKGKVLSRRRRQ